MSTTTKSQELQRELHTAIVTLGKLFPINPAHVVAQYQNQEERLQSIINRINLAIAALTEDWGGKAS